jgi:hypothetical protein
MQTGTCIFALSHGFPAHKKRVAKSDKRAEQQHNRQSEEILQMDARKGQQSAAECRAQNYKAKSINHGVGNLADGSDSASIRHGLDLKTLSALDLAATSWLVLEKLLSS